MCDAITLRILDKPFTSALHAPCGTTMEKIEVSLRLLGIPCRSLWSFQILISSLLRLANSLNGGHVAGQRQRLGWYVGVQNNI